MIRPADITSSVLQKVATSTDDMVSCISSAEAADMAGISYGTEKRASIKKTAVEKAADLLKTIPGDITESNDSLDMILNSIQDPSEDLLNTLKSYSLEDIIKSFAFLGINPSLKFLLKIITHKHIGSHEDEISNAAIGALKFYGMDSVPEDSSELIPEIDDHIPNEFLLKVLMKFQSDSSYEHQFVEKRAAHTGYTNWQGDRVKLEPSPFFQEKKHEGSDALLKLAGAAIIAKIMISTIVGMPKAAGFTSGVEKSAGLTEKLMDISIRNELKGNTNV